MVKIVLILALAICSITGKAYEDYDWWEAGNFYQIYPRSFSDSDGNGVGDLKGITAKLDHLKSINVTAAWLSPIFQSPMKDFGYDISDFRKIDKIFGTMEDFERLLARAKELNIKLILDFVPNHSSDQHEWFKKSADPNHPEHEKYKDYYIWNEGKLLENGTRVPPSNWLSIFRGSAWTWVEARKAYFLHQFLEEQPDLNYRNQAVVDEMKEILRFWLRKGVGGFRCDTVPMLYEVDVNADGVYDDEPLSGDCPDDPEAACYLKHTKTQDLDETYEMIYQWHEVLTEKEFSEFSRILMTEAYTSLENNLRYYGEVKDGKIVRYGSQIPFNFDLLTRTNKYTKAGEFKDHIEEWMNGMPKAKGVHANWVLGNHDQRRLASRYGPSRTDLLNIMIKTLPGNAVTYNGEEIGMTDVFISWEDTVDPQACRTNPEIYDSVSRDPGRTPFQWDSTKNAGFSTADKTWLPMATNYTDCNVELQNSQEKSHLKVFRALISLRQNPTFKYGGLQVVAIDDDLLAYKRELEGQAGSDIIVVVLNLGTSKKTIDLSSSFAGLPAKMQVAIASIHSDLSHGDTVDIEKLEITPELGLVLMGRKNELYSVKMVN